MLHQSFLANWDKWEQFLKDVQFFVIDEIHEYRGYFGTNMSLLVRRFLRKLYELGNHCQLILASATCANPQEHAFRLTGRRLNLIQNESVIHPNQNFAFINPNLPPHRYYRLYIHRIVRAGLACLKRNLSVVVFVPTRRFAEEAASKARREAESFGLDGNRIAPYRAGYKSDERRHIEDGLRSGEYQLVFSTNALELGIDIGRLDVCILAGFPDSVMSAWQRIGRAGRKWDKQAYILFYALDNPIDQFFVSNLNAFLEKPLDEITVGLENEELIKKHVPCLLYERTKPITKEDKTILGDYFWEKAYEAQKDFQPVRKYKPHFRVAIRNTSAANYKLMYNGESIGTISGEQAGREAYIGAIYKHFGKSYKVKSRGADEITLEKTSPRERTESLTYTTITGSNILKAIRYRKTIEWFYGVLTIYDNFRGYKLIDEETGEILQEQLQDNVTATKRSVQGCWLTIQESSLNNLNHIEERLAFVRYLLRTGTTFIIPCDRFDLGSYYSNNPPTAYIYETVPGGIGIVEKLFQIWPKALERGIKMAEECSRKCVRGCPYCLHIERYDKRIPIFKKIYGIELAKKLLCMTEDKSYEVFDVELGSWRIK